MAMSPSMKLLRASSKTSSMLSNVSREDIRLVYTFKKTLGSGSYGTVRLAHKTVSPGVNFAVKSINRHSFKGSTKDL